jgi:hypothetical protein
MRTSRVIRQHVGALPAAREVEWHPHRVGAHAFGHQCLHVQARTGWGRQPDTPTGARLNVQALVTPRVGPDTVFMPFHFSGRWQGADMLAYYPNGAAPIVRGEAINTATTYGYDSVTMMQETKTTVCNVEKA